jgi:hypothetical protein
LFFLVYFFDFFFSPERRRKVLIFFLCIVYNIVNAAIIPVACCHPSASPPDACPADLLGFDERSFLFFSFFLLFYITTDILHVKYCELRIDFSDKNFHSKIKGFFRTTGF